MIGPLLAPLAAAERRARQRAGQAYVAGPSLADALLVCRRLTGVGMPTTVGFWDGGDDPPRLVADTCLSAVGSLAALGPGSRLAVKAPALGLAVELVAEVVETSRQAGVAVHFDALGVETAEPTLALISALAPSGGPLGLTLPARWGRSADDADAAVELGLAVRVVKGQWPDESTHMPDPRRRFLDLVDRLAGRAPSRVGGHPRPGAGRGVPAQAGSSRDAVRARGRARPPGAPGPPGPPGQRHTGPGLRALRALPPALRPAKGAPPAPGGVVGGPGRGPRSEEGDGGAAPGRGPAATGADRRVVLTSRGASYRPSQERRTLSSDQGMRSMPK